MWDVLYLPALMFGWFALFRWVLPWFGVATCLSGSCGIIEPDESGRWSECEAAGASQGIGSPAGFSAEAGGAGRFPRP